MVWASRAQRGRLQSRARKLCAISPIQLPQKSNSEVLTIDLSAKRHGKGNCPALQLLRKIFAGLIYIHSDTGDRQMWRLFSRAHLDQNAGDLPPSIWTSFGSLIVGVTENSY